MPASAHATVNALILSKPAHSVVARLRELLGRRNDSSQAVYLSDVGHFDNLGFYEMLRRRCEIVVVVDAGQDETCTFPDLGQAQGRDAPKPVGYAVGRIRYPDAEEGRMVYVKPSLLPGSPVSIQAYGAAHSLFPHESTTTSGSPRASSRAAGDCIELPSEATATVGSGAAGRLCQSSSSEPSPVSVDAP